MKYFKIIGCFAVGATAIASFLLANNSSQKSVENLAMSNIEALYASASETTCDQKTKEDCLIAVYPIGSDTPIFGYSKGKMVVTH